jgi:hypothetical protein
MPKQENTYSSGELCRIAGLCCFPAKHGLFAWCGTTNVILGYSAIFA